MANVRKYPFNTMGVDESFVVVGVLPPTVRAAVQHFRLKNPEKRFSVSKFRGAVGAGSLIKRRADREVGDSNGDLSSFIMGVADATIYYGPGSYEDAAKALPVIKSSVAVDMVIVQAAADAHPAGYLNDWVAPALTGASK